MLGNIPPLWETMLAVMKLGGVIIPATTLLTPDDLADRISRGRVKHIICAAEMAGKLSDATKELQQNFRGRRGFDRGWHEFEKAYESSG